MPHPLAPDASVYGLTVRSDFPLPDRLARVGGRTPDVVFRSAAAPDRREAPTSVLSRPNYRAERYSDGQLRFTWPKLFDCVVSPDGADVAVTPLNTEADRAFTTHLFGHVLSFVLLKKGFEPLHSTVLASADGAIGILGESGYGKSTLAAGLLQSGMRLVTDDLLVVTYEGDDRLAHPGLPRLKLWPQAAARFLPGVPSHPMAPGTRKRIYPLEPPRWTPETSRLRAMYVLRRPVTSNATSRVTIRKVTQARAFMDLTRNTFNSFLVDAERLRGQFRFATELVARVPVRSLTYPPGFDYLPHVVDRLLHDVSRER